MTPYVFISYSSIDKKNAEDLNDSLNSIGIKTFLDQKRIGLGDNFKAKISTGLSQCTELVLIASPSSLNSQWVFFEIGQAVAMRRPIITLLTHPGLKLPSFLSDFQYTTSIHEISEHFKRRQLESSQPRGVRVIKDVSDPNSVSVNLGQSLRVRQLLNRFPPHYFHGNVMIDGAAELHTFPDQTNPYGGITHNQATTNVSTVEWSEIASTGLDSKKLDLLGKILRSWVGSRRAKPNRIRFLVEPPSQMVLDNNEFRMHIGNSDYFTMRTIAELSRISENGQPGLDIQNVFDTWWSSVGRPFPGSCVPYHISAQGVLFITDPSTKRTYIVLTLPSLQRSPLVPGWNASFAEQMWAPFPETPKEPWWEPYTDGLTIEAPKDRTGDKDIWDTVERGLYEELGLRQHELTATPKLVASCIEQDMYFVAFIFVLKATLTLQDFYKRKLSAPDKEIGPIAVFPIDGPRDGAGSFDPTRQLTELLSMEHFDGGPYMLPNATTSIEEPWHLSSRLRIYAAARHLVGAKLLDYINFTQLV